LTDGIRLQATGILYPFEIVCPDGLVRHFPYQHEGDATSDAAVAETKRCQFYPKPNRLEEAFGACPGGRHLVRRRTEA